LSVPSNDPKHGRWILPLIIGGMVLLTFTFVNSLDPSEGVEVTETTAEPPFPTTPTSSTTTLPANLAAYMVLVDAFENEATSFGQQAIIINNDWEARNILFNDARGSFNDLRATVTLWEQQVSDAAGDAPPELAEAHVALVLEAGHLAPAIEDIVLGLEEPDEGTLRRTAMDLYAVEIQELLDAIQDIRDAAAAAAATADTTDTTDGA
jgi:hypothetical protein